VGANSNKCLKHYKASLTSGGAFFAIDITQSNCNCQRMNSADAQAFADWQSKTAAEIADSHPNIYRECARQFLPIMYEALNYARQSPADRWGVYFALGHPDCLGESMASIASRIGISKASISNSATRFCKSNSLPPSDFMKDEENQDKAWQARNNTIKRNKQKIK
jgi:hypothetical protein